mgnify:CR=1 FL=1
MIIAKNDEEQRSKIWKIATITATIVIIVVAVYFLFDLFAGNPLEGTWMHEDSNLELAIRRGNTAVASWSEISETSNVKLRLKYTLNKEDKMISFKLESEEMAKAVKASGGILTEEALKAEISVLENTFDYSLDGGRLTLSEREYGEQVTLVKK